MTVTTGISPRHINTYHNTNSLLFQFIIVDFIEIFDEVQRLEMLCGRKPAALIANSTENLNSDATQKQIESKLIKLIGSPRDYMRLFAWSSGDSLLTKLKSYCNLFTQTIEIDEKEIIALQHYADKLCIGCLVAIDALREGPDERDSFLAAIDKISNATLRLSKLIARLLPQFKEDENVILCILRYKESLDRLYGNRFVTKLITRMYPKGLREAQQFLSRRYAERGFENVLPAIADKIAELEVSAL